MTLQAGEDFVINLIADATKLKATLAKAKQYMKTSGHDISKKLAQYELKIKRLNTQIAGAMKSPMMLPRGWDKDIVGATERFQTLFNEMPKTLDKSAMSMAGLFRGIGANVRKPIKAMDGFSAAVNTSNQKMDDMLKKKAEFPGYAMSIMFLGMAVQRVFFSIWQSSSEAFREVMSSVEGSVTAFDELEGQLMFLGFVSGQALEPLVEQITPLLADLNEWIQDNEKLYQGIVKWAAILGTVGLLFGMLRLGFGGLATAAGKAFAFIKATAGITGLATAAPFLIAFAKIAAIAALVYLLFKTNFAKTGDILSSFWETFKNTFAHVFGGIGDIFEGVFELLEGLLEGDTRKMFVGFLKIVKGALRIFVSLFELSLSFLYHSFAWFWNIVVEMALMLPRLFLDGLRNAIQTANKWFGWDISTKGVDAAASAVDSVRDFAQLPGIDDFKMTDGLDRGMDMVINIFQQPGEDEQLLAEKAGYEVERVLN